MNFQASIKTSNAVPVDFAQRAQGASNADLKRHYGVGDKVLARWRKEADVPATSGRTMALANQKMPVPADFVDFAKNMTNGKLAERFGVGEKTISRWRKETGTAVPIKAFNTAQLPKQFVPPIDSGLASEAGQFLRSFYVPVYHRGKVDGKQFTGQYVVGRQVLGEDDMIELARSKGFKTGSEQLADVFAKYDV